MRLAAIAACLAVAAPAMAQTPAALVGMYDGNQMELATALELRADGTFRYGLIYGALGEDAEGVWRVDKDRLLLTTRPAVVPPRFVVERDGPAPGGALYVELDDPEILQGSSLTLAVTYADSPDPSYVDADDDGRVPVDPARTATSVAPVFPVLDVPLTPVALKPGQGRRLLFRFEPNGLGKADFRDEPLAIAGEGLTFRRWDRNITFRRSAETGGNNQ